ncbi:MAG TPA: peptidase, partial [Phycisphaerales bacterium]|nr:peptidase [Phycisphaerales bacterium]
SAVEDAFRRAGGSDGENVFKQIDWPTPSEMRLGSGFPGPDYWQQRCDYDIDATLDTDKEQITASMRVTYHNNSPHELGYIWLNLEQNLFNTNSIGTKSRSPGSVMKVLEDDFDGGYTISNLRVAGVSGRGDFGLKVYDTLGRIDLPSPLRSGQSVVLEMDFSFPIPPHLRRMGAETVEQGKIFELAQWFPQVCKYDDVHGWNTLPYLGSGEFYTDFGNYRVAITVPQGYIVSGSGMLENPDDVLAATQRKRLDQAF